MRPKPEDLLQRAAEAAAYAYAPYSNYAVGAAVLAEDGTVCTGANVENASYGLTLCAERSAVCTALGQGHRRFLAVAIVGPETSAHLPYPCGACRQVLAEFCDHDCAIYAALQSDLSSHERITVGELLPRAFRL